MSNKVASSQSHHSQHGQTKNKTLVVGLTGGIGSGKSAASAWFAKQGIDIIDADVIAHETMRLYLT